VFAIHKFQLGDLVGYFVLAVPVDSPFRSGGDTSRSADKPLKFGNEKRK